jgi:hypothetical protein
VLNWTDTSAVELEPDIHQTSWTFDALNRVIKIKNPDESVVKNIFNKGGLLQSVSGNLKGRQQTTLFVASSEYDAYGRLIVQTAGNSTFTTNSFDRLTQRLTNRTVLRHEGTTRTVVQNLTHTYDPVGNVIFVQNDAEQTVFFRNGAVEPDSEYTYDAIYRITEATGREHVGQTKGAPSRPGMVTSFAAAAAPEDNSAIVRYVEQYKYDAANNITILSHQLADLQFSSWTRRFSYQSARNRGVSNRLMSTTVGNATENYTYNANGNITSMPHLSDIRWDYINRLRSSSQQILADGSPETTWYVYDGQGERVRKVTERQANPGETPRKLEERITIGTTDTYRSYKGDGLTVKVQYASQKIMDQDGNILVLAEEWSGPVDAPGLLLRYQLTNIVQSVIVELDDTGQVISYKEYSPYGTSTYQLLLRKVHKRFRFAGKEHDTNNGLYYFGMRYYAAVSIIRFLKSFASLLLKHTSHPMCL